MIEKNDELTWSTVAILLFVVWNSAVSAVGYLTWVGGAPMSFFVFFLGAFWLIGLIMITVAVTSTIQLLRLKLAG